MEPFVFSGVEQLPGYGRSVAFTVNAQAIYKEDTQPATVALDSLNSYIRWGANNALPFEINKLIENDETLATCQAFNAETCYGAGLQFDTCEASEQAKGLLQEFVDNNDLPTYFLGLCHDLKHYGFAVSVITLSATGNRVVAVDRREAMYCRFAKADATGRIPAVYYGNFRKSLTPESLECLPLLNVTNPFADLQRRVAQPDSPRRFAVLAKVPCADSNYYPTPHYTALFRGKWYNIKQLIGIAKEAKLRNSAPIKYHVEVNSRYFERIFEREHISDPKLQQERVNRVKREIVDFLTGAENSGKAWFSEFSQDPTGTLHNDIRIVNVETRKEGGDWETDIQEAINMFCFTMRIHSNLIGSVPGKAQSNNSGSDKRELYTIQQALQKPYRDILLRHMSLVIRFNGWSGVKPLVPFIQLTTLDEHRDAKEVNL